MLVKPPYIALFPLSLSLSLPSFTYTLHYSLDYLGQSNMVCYPHHCCLELSLSGVLLLFLQLFTWCSHINPDSQVWILISLNAPPTPPTPPLCLLPRCISRPRSHLEWEPKCPWVKGVPEELMVSAVWLMGKKRDKIRQMVWTNFIT